MKQKIMMGGRGGPKKMMIGERGVDLKLPKKSGQGGPYLIFK